MKAPRGSRVPKKDFFTRDTVRVAGDLLGHFLFVEKKGHRLGGRIVETEAYLYRNDPACHASRGMTKRNRSMFEEGGIAYVYFIYGMYHCLNIVTGPEGEGTAVLIRSLEPLDGIEQMKTNRPNARSLEELANGPGKLTRALGITKDDDATDLIKGHIRIFLDPALLKNRPRVIRTHRIGINRATDLKLRFFLEDHPCVSTR